MFLLKKSLKEIQRLTQNVEPTNLRRTSGTLLKNLKVPEPYEVTYLNLENAIFDPYIPLERSGHSVCFYCCTLDQQSKQNRISNLKHALV